MELLLVATGLVLLDWVALRWGADSRPTVDDRRPWWPGRAAARGPDQGRTA